MRIGKRCLWRKWCWVLLGAGSMIVCDLGFSCTQLTGLTTQVIPQITAAGAQPLLGALPPFVADTLTATLQQLLGGILAA